MAQTQRHEQTALGIERIVADLAAAEFIPPSRGSRGPTFDGAPHSVIFVRNSAGPQTGPGLEIVRIAEAGTAREPLVIRTHTRFVPRVAAQRDPIDYRDPVVLLRAPYRLSFSYAGRDRVWRDRWQELELPSAIRLTLQDVTTRKTLSVSTATSVHSGLSADCIHAKSFDECLNQRLSGPRRQTVNRALDMPRNVMCAPTSESMTPDAASGGFILVAVLWILGALSALVSIYAVYVMNTSAGLTVHDDRLRAEALTSAALELTADRILSATKESAPVGGRFEFRLSAARVDVEYQPENARVDLNAAPKPLLVGLFSALGSHQRDAEIYGDRIVAWRTPPANEKDTEAAAYRTARLGYEQRGAKFPHAAELSLVRDLPLAVVERVLPFVTVYSGRPQVNVMAASPKVLAALPGVTLEGLNAILALRQAAQPIKPRFCPCSGPHSNT